MNLQDHELMRVLGYTLENFEVYNRPLWLAPFDTWDKAIDLGYLEKSDTKPFVPRIGVVVVSYRLTGEGLRVFNDLQLENSRIEAWIQSRELHGE